MHFLCGLPSGSQPFQITCMIFRLIDSRINAVDFRGNMVDAFRTHIMQTKDLGTCPVRQIGGCSFLYMRISNVYIVTVVSSNANAACAFKFSVEVKHFLSVENAKCTVDLKKPTIYL
jgi:hypothetical protein